MIRLTSQAQAELRPDEVLVFDWHRVAICCACAGEVSLRRAARDRVEGSPTFRRIPAGGAEVYAHRQAFPHLVGRPITIHCRRTFGVRRFASDLPPDFGLRASLGRV